MENKMGLKSGSKLEKVLKAGHFAFTGELGPPRGADPEAVIRKAAYFKGTVDAVNVTDNQAAIVRMAAWAGCALLVRHGLEPNYQMVCRDRNRMAMQADILGAHALGVRNILCLSGDHPCRGDHPGAKGVFDIDSIQLVAMVKKMRDESLFLGGGQITGAPKMFIGAVANPFAEPLEWRVLRLAKKAAAGADFIQTQCVYNMERFREFMHVAHDMGVTQQVHILAGIMPLKSVKMGRFIQSKVPGMDVPDAIMERLAGVAPENVAEEGIKIALEQIEQLRRIKGVAGVHLMAMEWEHKIPEIAERAGLLPRPQVD